MLDEYQYVDRFEFVEIEFSRCKYDKYFFQFKNLINFLFFVILVKIFEL